MTDGTQKIEQTDRTTNVYTDLQTNVETDRQTVLQTVLQTEKRTNSQADGRKTCILKDVQRYKQTDSQTKEVSKTEKQTN